MAFLFKFFLNGMISFASTLEILAKYLSDMHTTRYVLYLSALQDQSVLVCKNTFAELSFNTVFKVFLCSQHQPEIVAASYKSALGLEYY